IESELGGEGRVLVRPSGTEPVVRVIAETPGEARTRALVAGARAALAGRRTRRR
ncbi:MAG TPA: phosphoglucosamine mutase, partial [Candidatus Dormibacteraeota bacterium]|nr:phosphoglucosamine mutase [Candidatus Dormibacteraeota bacterium]